MFNSIGVLSLIRGSHLSGGWVVWGGGVWPIGTPVNPLCPREPASVLYLDDGLMGPFSGVFKGLSHFGTEKRLVVGPF